MLCLTRPSHGETEGGIELQEAKAGQYYRLAAKTDTTTIRQLATNIDFQPLSVA